MLPEILQEYPHRRYNPFSDSWILVAPQRSKRPWQGITEGVPDVRPAYDPGCYLCPGNQRAGGNQTPLYEDVYVFDNDFSALLPDLPAAVRKADAQSSELFKIKADRGISRVVCFSPRHDLAMAEMHTPDIRKVVDVWVKEYETLGALPFINHVQIFENKGAMMGSSNPHPHGQIWAQEHLPTEQIRKQRALSKYWKKHHRTLLEDYLREELERKERILFENEAFVALVPFWACWPFEAMIIPRRSMASISAMSDGERTALADSYRRLAVTYDRLFRTSFPYASGIHQAPTDGKPHPEWHFHLVFYPPLLRSATIRKYMGGYELLGEPQRDLTPEWAAARLRELLGD